MRLWALKDNPELWSVRGRADALWVCQLTGLQRSTEEVRARRHFFDKMLSSLPAMVDQENPWWGHGSLYLLRKYVNSPEMNNWWDSKAPCLHGWSLKLSSAQQFWESMKGTLGSAQASSVPPIPWRLNYNVLQALNTILTEGLVVFPAASFFPPPLLQKTLARWPGCWYHNMLSHMETRQSLSVWIVFSTTYGGENRQWEGTWFVTVHPNVRSIVLPKNDRLK